ncbi:MAG: helix-turn-helix domain-containing protein [Aestuariivirga sp.]
MDDFQTAAPEPAPAPYNSAQECSAEVDALSTELLGHVADKWTLVVLEELAEQGTLRFTELRRKIPGVSQKMLTQTLRQMERVGLVTRNIHPVIPPKVEYQLTKLGYSLGGAVCQLWRWVAENAAEMEVAKVRFDSQA